MSTVRFVKDEVTGYRTEDGRFRLTQRRATNRPDSKYLWEVAVKDEAAGVVYVIARRPTLNDAKAFVRLYVGGATGTAPDPNPNEVRVTLSRYEYAELRRLLSDLRGGPGYVSRATSDTAEILLDSLIAGTPVEQREVSA